MSIVLTERVVTAKTFLEGSDEFNVVAGKSLKIETSPSGDDILDEEVPVGKTWHVIVSVAIEETDA